MPVVTDILAKQHRGHFYGTPCRVNRCVHNEITLKSKKSRKFVHGKANLNVALTVVHRAYMYSCSLQVVGSEEVQFSVQLLQPSRGAPVHQRRREQQREDALQVQRQHRRHRLPRRLQPRSHATTPRGRLRQASPLRLDRLRPRGKQSRLDAYYH